WEAISSLEDEQTKKLGLHGYYEWKDWLMKSANDMGFAGDENIWLYTRIECSNVEKFSKLSYLGKTVWLTAQKEKHIVCEKQWTCYEIRSADLMKTEALCGFMF